MIIDFSISASLRIACSGFGILDQESFVSIIVKFPFAVSESS